MREVLKDKKYLMLIVIDVVVSAAAKLLHPVFSIYEVLLIFYALGCLMTYAYFVRLGKIKLEIVSLLRLSCFIAMGVACFSTMTYGQANIHGDTAIATQLARAEVRHHSIIPKTWCYANGDVWILDTQLAVLPFTLLMRDQVTARMLGTLIMVLIGIISMYLLDRFVLGVEAYIISLPVILVFLFGGDTDILWGNDHMLYQASYTCWLFFIPMMCILVYRLFIEDRFSWKLYILYIIFAIICFARGVRPMAELMIPLALAYPLHVFIRDGIAGFRQWLRYILFIAPILAGCAMYVLICRTHIVNSTDVSGMTFVSDLKSAYDNMVIVFMNLFDVFGYNGSSDLATMGGLASMVSILCCILFIFILPLLQIRAYKEEPDGVKFFFMFAMVHNAEMVISTIFFDKTSPSHILSFVLVSIMISSCYVMRHWIGDRKHAFIYGIMFGMASLIMIAQLGFASRGWQGKVIEKRATAQTMIDQGLDACKGYGTFWNIYPLSIYSDLKLDVAAIGNSDIALSLNPHLNLVDTDKYIPENKGSYILLNYNENKEMGESLESIFGECKEKFNIGENYIYVWDYDVCTNRFSGTGVNDT